METRILKSQRDQKVGTTRLGSPEMLATEQIKSLLTSVLADICSHCVKYSIADYTRDVLTLERRLDNEGIGFAARVLPTLAKGMFQYLETGEATYPGFKLQAGKKYPRFLKGIFYVIYGAFRDDVKAHAINCVYQLSVTFKKLKGDYSEKLISEKYADFVEVDREMGTIFDNLSDENFQILQLARSFFNQDWKDFDVFGLDSLPKPGPGATRSKTPKHLRYEPHMFFSPHQQFFPYEEWFYSHPWAVVDTARDFMRMQKATHFGYPSARMCYVPKYYGTPRGICIEENESQWLQQGCATGMRRHVEKHPFLSGHVEFSDQGINATHAFRSSIDQEDATIDMEGGSDRHPRDIVSWVTQDNASLHNALMCLSTRYIDPPIENLEQLKTNKYAPMGSGLCFPVMSLMHYYLILAIVSRVHKVTIRNRLFVYGDDIVIPTVYTDTVFDVLPHFGMKLNRNKSFARSKFRESCGVHAYNGMDVTPVFVRRTLRPGKIDTLVSTLATEELLFNKGFFHVAKCLRTLFEKTHGHVPFVTQQSPLVGWKRPTALLTESDYQYIRSQKKRRAVNKSKHTDFQCYEYRVRIIKSAHDPDIDMRSDTAYLRWLTQHTEDSLHYQGDLSQQRLGWRWLTEASCMPSFCGTKKTRRDRLYDDYVSCITARNILVKRCAGRIDRAYSYK